MGVGRKERKANREKNGRDRGAGREGDRVKHETKDRQTERMKEISFLGQGQSRIKRESMDRLHKEREKRGEINTL